MMDMRIAYRLWSEHLKERDHTRDVSVDGTVILKLISEN